MKGIAIAVGALLVLAGVGFMALRGPAETSLEPQSAAGEIALPTGRSVTLHDTVWGQPGTAGLTIRFRFVEPDLRTVTTTMDYEDIEADMHFLCETYALGRISNIGPQPAQIVVSISSAPVEFGTPDPNIVQIFESYRPEDGQCIWESF